MAPVTRPRANRGRVLILRNPASYSPFSPLSVCTLLWAQGFLASSHHFSSARVYVLYKLHGGAETLLGCISLYHFTFILLLDVHDNLDLVKKGEEWGDGPLLYPYSPGEAVCLTAPQHGPCICPPCYFAGLRPHSNPFSYWQVVCAWPVPSHLSPCVCCRAGLRSPVF